MFFEKSAKKLSKTGVQMRPVPLADQSLGGSFFWNLPNPSFKLPVDQWCVTGSISPSQKVILHPNAHTNGQSWFWGPEGNVTERYAQKTEIFVNSQLLSFLVSKNYFLKNNVYRRWRGSDERFRTCFSILFVLFSGAFSIFVFFTFFIVLERNCFENIFQNRKIL